MNLEGLIRRQLTDNEELVGKLAVYAKEPAVFYQEAPGDTQAGWSRKTQFPRIVFNVDMLADRERKRAGTLGVTLFCDLAGTLPEDLEPLVRESLTNVILKTDTGTCYCFAWNRTDAFDMPGTAGARVGGDDIRFDIVEYSEQYSTDPDPIIALNAFIDDNVQEAFILCYDEMEDSLIPTDDRPVVYCRLESSTTAPDETLGGTVAWMNAKITVHVLCPDTHRRMQWVMQLTNALSAVHEIRMLDKSPMRLMSIQANTGADYLKEGQISIGAHYGILIGRPVGPPMGGVNLDF